jgi:glutamate racemase
MIGFFDSGLGGLAIWKAVHERLPELGTLYFGDQANSPYGIRSQEEIIALTKAGVDRLFQEGAVIVILACNTASAAALRSLQKDWLPLAWPDRRILGVLAPTVEAVTGQSWANEAPMSKEVGSVAVFATPATIASGAYVREIQKRAPGLSVTGVACPNLVPLIESGAPQEELQQEVMRYAKEAGEVDTAILGCTHYALIASAFKKVLPESIVIDQGQAVAESLEKYLKHHPELQERILTAIYRFATSGSPVIVEPLAKRFAGIEGASWECWQ